MPVSKLGPPFCRALENDKTESLKINKGKFGTTIILSVEGKRELEWWFHNVEELKEKFLCKV